MIHKTVRTGIAIALLGLSACSQYLAEDVVVVEEAVMIEEPASLARKPDCAPTDMEDGIGGTGCPAIVE